MNKGRDRATDPALCVCRPAGPYPGQSRKRRTMPEKVLVYSRFPKALMLRIGERFDLMDAAGKPPNEVFSADQLSGINAMITAGGKAPGGAQMGTLPPPR